MTFETDFKRCGWVGEGYQVSPWPSTPKTLVLAHGVCFKTSTKPSAPPPPPRFLGCFFHTIFCPLKIAVFRAIAIMLWWGTPELFNPCLRALKSRVGAYKKFLAKISLNFMTFAKSEFRFGVKFLQKLKKFLAKYRFTKINLFTSTLVGGGWVAQHPLDCLF